ncbi:MAG: hypothetical protein WD749_11655 [Phycisphaerales bacterium]
MSQFDQIPYYREYLDHILKPRVIRALDDIRARFAERAWAELVARMAEEQRPGASADPEAITRLRAMLEQGLRLQLAATVSASFGGAPAEGPAANGAEARAGEAVEAGFPDNPLARAVGGVRRVASR